MNSFGPFDDETVKKVFIFFAKNPQLLLNMGYTIAPKGEKMLELLGAGWKWDEALEIVEAIEWEDE